MSGQEELLLAERRRRVGKRRLCFSLFFQAARGYGVRVTAGEQTAVCRGVCTDPARARALFSALARFAVFPCHLQDVVEDWLSAE